MKIVLCGESWGRAEAQFRHPLVGATGRELAIQLGISELAPFLTLTCRECKKQTPFKEVHCTHCHEHIWPNEFDLIDHWTRLRRQCNIHVTNVFNMKPPDICMDCGAIDQVRPSGRSFSCKLCNSRNIRTNEIGYLFSIERQTDLPSWKASKDYGGSHLKCEFYHHVERLWKELQDLRPNLIIALGNAACWALLGQTKISALRGNVNWSDRLNLKVLPTYHPAAVLRQWPFRPAVIADLRKAKLESEFPEIRRPKRWITIPHPSERGLNEICEWLTPRPKLIANDIETVRRQISIIGFAKSKDESLVIPFRDCHSKNGQIVDIGAIGRSIGINDAGINFWPTPELEIEAWKLAIDVIENRNVSMIFQNGVYDMSYYLKMGILPYSADEDTMLWHHAEYPELPKALGFLGSLYLNDISWKQMNRQNDSLKRDE